MAKSRYRPQPRAQPNLRLLPKTPAPAYANPAAPTPATQPLEPRLQDTLTEYLSGDGISWLQNYVKSLPPHIDDATADLGDDLYDRMLRDATIRGNINALKAGILDDGLRLTSAIVDIHDPRYAKSQEVLAFCAYVLDRMNPHIDAVLWDMLDALANGNRLAELSYKVIQYKGKPKLAIAAVKVKPRHVYSYVMDPYNTLIGVQGLIPGVGFPVQTGTYVIDPANTPNLLPLEQVAILTIRGTQNDPRGTSLLRACYTAWWQKMQVWPEYLKFLTQFASPLIAATMGQVTGPVTQGGKTVSAADNLLAALEALRNGACIVLPNGTILDVKQSSGEGTAFLKGFDLHNQEITIAMLSQTLATGAHKANTRAAATVHQDVLVTLTRQLQTIITVMVKSQLLYRLVEYNYGETEADELTPNASLGQEERPDLAAILSAAAPVMGFKVYASQLAALHAQMGLPPADPEEVKADIAAQLAINKTVGATGVPAAQSHNLLPAPPGSPAAKSASAPPNRMSAGQSGGSSVGSPQTGRNNGEGAPTAAGASSKGSSP